MTRPKRAAAVAPNVHAPRDQNWATWVASLRSLMVEHRLTQQDVAGLALVSIKTVEGWLAAESAASHRHMHERHLRSIERALAAKRRRKE